MDERYSLSSVCVSFMGINLFGSLIKSKDLFCQPSECLIIFSVMQNKLLDSTLFIYHLPLYHTTIYIHISLFLCEICLSLPIWQCYITLYLFPHQYYFLGTIFVYIVILCIIQIFISIGKKALMCFIFVYHAISN